MEWLSPIKVGVSFFLSLNRSCQVRINVASPSQLFALLKLALTSESDVRLTLRIGLQVWVTSPWREGAIYCMLIWQVMLDDSADHLLVVLGIRPYSARSRSSMWCLAFLWLD